MPLGKQAVDTLSALVELQEVFWSLSLTSEGGYIYAPRAVRMTLHQKDRIEIYVKRSCNTLRDADMIKKGSSVKLSFVSGVPMSYFT